MGPVLTDYEVIVCVTGGIAAYKTAAFVSKLVQDGAGVSVAMTPAAQHFVGVETFQGLTGRPVLTSVWSEGAGGDMAHLDPSERADLIVVAPATANIIGKLASGIADDLVSTLLLGADCPAMLAPAMNTRMWNHPAVKRNIEFLRANGFPIVGPGEGHLACGTQGAGRMLEPDELLVAARAQLHKSLPRIKQNKGLEK